MSHQLRNVQQIQAAKEGAFAAILADGISDKEGIYVFPVCSQFLFLGQ